jgi:flagellar basal body-associated protein FliL
MANKKKILLIVTAIALAVGGFAITQWWIKKVTRIRGGIVIKQEFEEPTNTEPLSK